VGDHRAVDGSTRGRLLVATPPLADPNFDRTVVLMLEHNDEGAFGLVLNRPSVTEVAAVFPDWSNSVMWPTRVFVGGPVEAGAVIALGLRVGDVQGGFVPVLGSLGTVDLARLPGEVPGLRCVRLFAGYASWAPGQLESELDAHAWLVLEADEADPFSADPGQLWRVVLGRQCSQVAWLANYPDDVLAN
jgi:putative transcriptional regulator